MPKHFAGMLAIAVGLTLWQIGYAMLLSGQPTADSAWRSLYQSDGGWFSNIMDEGYYFPQNPTYEFPGNVAFYPAYPLVSKAVGVVFRLDNVAAMLATSQFFCAVFWYYFQFVLRQLGVTGKMAAGSLLLFAAHPTNVFLVATYSESLFLAAMLGFVAWCSRETKFGFATACFHGTILTSTRLVGLPLAILPLLLLAFAGRKSPGAWLRAGANTLFASTRALAYFAFLQWKFGQWNAFTVTQRVGWGVVPDYFVFFRWNTYDMKYGEILQMHRDVGALNRMTLPLSLLHFAAVAALEAIAIRSGSKRWKVRVPLWLLAVGLFAVPAMSHAGREWFSLARFALTWHCLLVAVAASQLTDGPRWLRTRPVLLLIAAGIAWAAFVQHGTLQYFAIGGFVG